MKATKVPKTSSKGAAYISLNIPEMSSLFYWKQTHLLQAPNTSQILANRKQKQPATHYLSRPATIIVQSQRHAHLAEPSRSNAPIALVYPEKIHLWKKICAQHSKNPLPTMADVRWMIFYQIISTNKNTSETYCLSLELHCSAK